MRRGGRARCAVADDEIQPEPEYDQMDVGDIEAEEDVDDVQQLQWQRPKRLPEPDPGPLDDYPGGPHDAILLTGYHVHVARKTS